MSLLSTLAKAAVGMMVAKKVGGLLGGKKPGQRQGGGLNDILGQLTKGQQGQASQGGGLQDILGQLTKGQGGAQGGGGLSDILGQLTKGQGGQAASNPGGVLGGILGGNQQQPQPQAAPTQQGGGLGGLGGLLGGLLGGKAPQGGSGGLGGLGGLLDQLAPKQNQPQAGGGHSSGHAAECSAGAATTGAGGLGDLLNQAMGRYGEPEAQPTAQQDAAAGVLLSAMIQAAKSDGQIDAAEKDALLKNLGDISQAEMDFVNQQMVAPVDPAGLARQVPNGMQQQAYMMSVLAIDLDTQNEATYLHEFATALGLQPDVVNAIHQQMGEPALYS